MTTDTVGGVWAFTTELARVLSQRGYQVWLAAMGGLPSAGQEREVSEIPGVRLWASAYKLEWMSDPWEDVENAGRWLLELEQQFQPHVIHLNSFGQAHLPWQAGMVLTAHSCVASWWRAVRRAELPREWNRYVLQVSSAWANADAVIAPSHAMAGALEAGYGYDSKLVRIIPNGRSTERFGPAPKEPFVFSAGRLWDEAKNISALARISPLLSWPVYLAGSTRSVGGHESEPVGCRCLGLLDQSELVHWYGRASIYALPAYYEPFGLSILEAALSGCALVLGDIPSLREHWEGAALFVPPGDLEALRRAISELIANPGWRDLMGRRARMRGKLFPAERMADSYIALYQAVMERRLVCAS